MVKHFKEINIKRSIQVAFSLFIFISILVLFWTTSRYPDLNEKAAMDERQEIGVLFFNPLLQITKEESQSSPVIYIFKVFINWSHTNWKGMLFGILLAASAMTLISLFKESKFLKSKILNSLTGGLFGATLGVCVNCATPIGRGFLEKKLPLAFILSLVTSSPTLNIIVLSMLFSLFPFYFALAKLIFSLSIIFLVIPLLVKLVGKKSPELSASSVKNFTQSNAANMFSSNYLSNLWFITKTTIPLMLLAGAIGSILIWIFPLNQFSDQEFSLITLLIITLVGTLVPVPIAFDIAFVSVLYSSGVNLGYCFALIASLGIYSIYPVLQFNRLVKKRIVIFLLLCITGLAFAGGVFFNKFEKQQEYKLKASFPLDENFGTDITSICSKIDVADYRDKCIYMLNLRLASNKRDVKICNNITNMVHRTSCIDLVSELHPEFRFRQCTTQACKQRVILHKMKIWGNMDDDCKDLDQRACVELSILKMLRNKKSSLKCSQFKNSDIKSTCISLQNINNCKLIPDEIDNLRCIARLLKKAKNRVDARATCNQQTDQVKKCFIQWLISRKKKISACERYDAENRNFCLFQFYLQKGQRSLQQRRLSTHDALYSADLKALKIVERNEEIRIPLRNAKKLNLAFQQGAVSVYSLQLNKRFKTTNNFSEVQSPQSGISNIPIFAFDNLGFNFRGYGLALGDFNNDKYLDLAVGTNNQGIILFENRGGDKGNLKFIRKPLPKYFEVNGETHKIIPVNISMVDLNSDGLLDIYFSNFDGHSCFIPNIKNSFLKSTIQCLPFNSNGLAIAVGFADFNKDSYLDIYLGRWFWGMNKDFQRESTKAKSQLFLGQEGSSFRPTKFRGYPYETLSILISDIDQDGTLEVIEGNDFHAPDILYTWNKNSLTELNNTSSPSFISPLFTMSYDSADIDNNLTFDIYSVGISLNKHLNRGEYCDIVFSDTNARDNCRLLTKAIRLSNLGGVLSCSDSESDLVRTHCQLYSLIRYSHRKRATDYCRYIPEEYQRQKIRCTSLKESARASSTPSSTHTKPFPQQYRDGNILLVNRGNGLSFKDSAETLGVKYGGYGWNAKFSDFDNNQWVDLYTSSGKSEFHQFSGGALLLNDGRSFSAAEPGMAPDNLGISSSYVVGDLDLDGDLDIITNTLFSQPRLFINNLNNNSSISFEINDLSGNFFGIGARIIIHTKNGKQIREIKASGGYASFDPPIAHFGLANLTSVNKVEVLWSTGTRTILKHEFKANHRYIISR